MTVIQALQESIATGKLVVVTGAGTSLALADRSVPAKGWKELVASGLSLAQIKGKISEKQAGRWSETLNSDDIDELLGAAEFVSSKLGGPSGILYTRWFENTFKYMSVGACTIKESIKRVAKCNVPMCTLNYDTLLEETTGLNSSGQQ